MRVALGLAAGAVVALILMLSIDSLLAVNRMNPVPAAKSAVGEAGWDIDNLHLRSYEVSGGPMGSSAVVAYGRTGAEGDAGVEVRLRRRLLSWQWETVAVTTK